jgi:hypothetical protein
MERRFANGRHRLLGPRLRSQPPQARTEAPSANQNRDGPIGLGVEPLVYLAFSVYRWQHPLAVY